MKKIIFNLLIASFFLTGCQENWKDFYTEKEESETVSTATENLLEYLQEIPEYSEFVKLLETTKISEELTRNQILTIWIPTNATMPSAEIAAMSDIEKQTLCRNHINFLALYNTKLTDNKVIKTLAGKNLLIRETAVGNFSIDGKNVVKLNQKCTNGVIHEIDNWLLPQKSIFEYLLGAGPEYSMMRDSILALSDTIFKPGLSFPLGVDELGNTIYDSVFVIENSLLFGKADIRSEDEDFTFFLSSNQVIENMYQKMGDYFANSGGEFTQSDSSKFFKWILRSSIYDKKIDNYAGHLKSVHGNEWRTEYQLVKPGYKTQSNGYLYEVEKIHIPKYSYMTNIKAYPAYLLDMDAETTRPNYYKVENATFFESWVQDGRTLLRVEGNKTEPRVKFEFKTLIKDRYGNLMDGKVLPGLYNIKASYRCYKGGKVKLSINDEEVATYDASVQSKFNYLPGLIYENFEIKEEWGFDMLWIRQEEMGKGSDGEYSARMVMEYILLEPSTDNY